MADADSTPVTPPCKTCGGLVRYKDGKCKACVNARTAQYNLKNKEALRAKNAEYREKNKEAIKQQKAARYQENRDEIRKKQNAYNALEATKEARRAYDLKNSEKRSAYNAKYRLENPERIKAKRKEHRAKNIDEIKKYASAYRAANRAIRQKKNAEWVQKNYRQKLQINHNYRARVKGAGGTLSKGLTEKLFKLQKGKCPCCKMPLGTDYHLDHKMPLALGGPNTDDNIQLLRASCNSSKHDRHPIDFMQSRGFLL
jgi:hypothetical protein